MSPFGHDTDLVLSVGCPDSRLNWLNDKQLSFYLLVSLNLQHPGTNNINWKGL